MISRTSGLKRLKGVALRGGSTQQVARMISRTSGLKLLPDEINIDIPNRRTDDLPHVGIETTMGTF